MLYRYLIFLILLLLPAAAVNAKIYAFSDTDYVLTYLERVANASDSISTYLKLIINEEYFNSNITEFQDHDMMIKLEDFTAKDSSIFYLIFDIYCRSVSGTLKGGEYKIGHDQDGVNRNYMKAFTCTSETGDTLFSSETDGSFYKQLTYIKLRFTPKSFQTLEQNIISMRAKENAKNDVIGFYGTDKDRHIVYYREQNKLIYRFEYRDKSRVFFEKFDDIVGTLKQDKLGSSKPLYIGTKTSIKGVDCSIRSNEKVFIYPVNSCILEFHNLVYPMLDFDNFHSATVRSILGKFVIYPLRKE